MNQVLAIILSYFLGSIPTAYLVGRYYKGLDIREHGSGNVGATNAFRVLGKGPGIFVLIIDVLKGAAALLLIGRFFNIVSALGIVLLSVAVVCGHNWTIFLQFKGGKGIATSLGVLIGIVAMLPTVLPVLIICLLVWGGVFWFSRMISLASMIASVALPLAMFVSGQVPEMVLLGSIFCVFVIYRHRSNMTRIFYGTEPQVTLPIFKRKRC